VIDSFLTLLSPLLLAALGGLYSEKAGLLNISLEGLMILSAFISLAVYSVTGYIVIALLAGIGASLLLTLLFIFSALLLKSDPFVSGLGINILAFALVPVLSGKIFGTESTVRPNNVEIPWEGLFPSLALLSFLFTVIFFHRTNPGRLIRLCGGSPDKLRMKGHSPEKVQAFSLLIGAFFTGVSGAALSLPLGVFVPAMSAGKGWIALVAVYLGEGKAVGILPAVAVFSLFDLWAVNLQQFHNIPADFILSAPYLLTLLFTIFLKLCKKITKY
jgi:general nucleoside transport system permease protein